VVIDQLSGWGGRLLERDENTWERDRIVDKDRAGRPFGFSGISLESRSEGARLEYALSSEETKIRLYYHARPEGGSLRVRVDEKVIGKLDTKRADAKSLVETFEITDAKPAKDKVKKGKGKRDRRKLEIIADGPGVRLYGISFESDRSGVYYDSIGPLGGDAKVYNELDQQSFTEHLTLHAPDLVVVMVGGNDAMKARKGWTDLEKIKRDHEQLLDVLKRTLPDTACLIWSPMDAGEKDGKKVISKDLLQDVRDMQKALAKSRGCAFFDIYASMGGRGSIERWVKAKVMNDDLVHPREKAAELLGELFLESFQEATSK
jgi:lysophospholipase L1-like esterase